jgi:hypothetical protein
MLQFNHRPYRGVLRHSDAVQYRGPYGKLFNGCVLGVAPVEDIVGKFGFDRILDDFVVRGRVRRLVLNV